jgi:hypothetical protein
MPSRTPTLRHVFKTTGGETITVPHRDAHRVVDKRTDQAPPEPCWEIKLPSGIVRRYWMDELVSWEMEER